MLFVSKQSAYIIRFYCRLFSAEILNTARISDIHIGGCAAAAKQSPEPIVHAVERPVAATSDHDLLDR